MAINQEQFIQAVRTKFPLRNGFASTIHRDRFLQFKGLFSDAQEETTIPWVNQGSPFKDYVLHPTHKTGAVDSIILDVSTGSVDRRLIISGHRDDLVSESLQRFLAESALATPFRRYKTLVTGRTSGLTTDIALDGHDPMHLERTWKKDDFAWPNGHKLSLEVATVTDVVSKNGHIYRKPYQVIFTIREKPNSTVTSWEKKIWMMQHGNTLERKSEEWRDGEPASSADRKMLRDLFEIAADGIYKKPITRSLRRLVIQDIKAEPGKMRGITQ